VVDGYPAVEHLWALGREAFGEEAARWVAVGGEGRAGHPGVRGGSGEEIGVECGGGPDGRIFSGEARADGVSGLSEGGVSRRIKSSDDFGTHPQEGLDRQTV
jgi:hypothetical protein